jgi:Hint domain/Sel1 repeat
MYFDGRGVSKDFAEAIKWYSKAADHGDRTAQYNLGLMYDRGLGVPKDHVAAATWFQKAADHGHTEARLEGNSRAQAQFGSPVKTDAHLEGSRAQASLEPMSLTSCLLRGTRISTALGERPVQDLKIGDQVLTLNGFQSIKWVDYDKFKKAAGKDRVDRVRPIRVARFAIDERTPRRDLYLSAAHIIFIDNVLIPVEYLVNGGSIAPGAPPDLDTIEYYHLEFEAHEVFHAEGMPVESYRGSNREGFSNFVQFERLYGVECPSEKEPFAPIVGYHGGRDEAMALVRTLVSGFVDIRDPIQVAWDRIAARDTVQL